MLVQVGIYAFSYIHYTPLSIHQHSTSSYQNPKLLMMATNNDEPRNSADHRLTAPRCSDSRRSLRLQYCNIRGLLSNFLPVEHHLGTSKPDLLFLSETQVSESSDSSSFSVPYYHLYTNFQYKRGCCVYVHDKLTCSRVPDLESKNFSVIWLRLSSHSTTKFLCSVYLS